MAWYRTPSVQEVQRAETALYNCQKAEEAVCEVFGVPRAVVLDSRASEEFAEKHGFDLLYDVFTPGGRYYTTGKVIYLATRNDCGEEEEAWISAAHTALYDMGIHPTK